MFALQMDWIFIIFSLYHAIYSFKNDIFGFVFLAEHKANYIN